MTSVSAKWFGLRVVVSLFFVQTALAGTYYVDYATGSDANSGNSKAAPWKHAPQMKGFSGSYSHSAGDRFIFKGGVIWPVTCFQMAISAGGSADDNRDYYGVDPTWFAGGAFARPVFDFQHIALGSGYNSGAGLLVTGSNLTLDGLEMANHRGWTGNAGWGSSTVNIQGANANITVTNCYIHD